jgi:hypothetical protein
MECKYRSVTLTGEMTGEIHTGVVQETAGEIPWFPVASTNATPVPEKHGPHPGATAAPPADIPCQVYCAG